MFVWGHSVLLGILTSLHNALINGPLHKITGQLRCPFYLGVTWVRPVRICIQIHSGVYSQVLLYHGPIYHDIAYGTAITVAESESDFRITTDMTDTPYLALMGEQWGVFCEDFGENWPHYKNTAMYLVNSFRPMMYIWACEVGHHWFRKHGKWNLQKMACCLMAPNHVPEFSVLSQRSFY